MLRLRSDEQLVALFRAGNDEAFRTIHDRYRQRLFAYTRQMLAGRQDAEDALQDVFVRAYSGLRANDRQVALRAWLYRVAHNRCVDELRRPLVRPAEVFELISVPQQDPVAQADQRESLRRLIADVRRLPEHQRSALLMRELSGMSYIELAEALETTVPAVKSLLVRARMALAQALQARDTSCAEIREALVLAQDRRVRPSGTARRHMRDCPGCRDFRHDLRGVSRELAALTPAIGPIGVVAKLLGFGFGGGAGGSAAMGGGTAAAGGASASAAGTSGALASAGALVTGAGHVATLIVATVVTAGGAVEIQRTISPAPAHARVARHAAPAHRRGSAPAPAASVLPAGYSVASSVASAAAAAISAAAPAAPPAVLISASTATAPAPAKPSASPARTSKTLRTAKGGSARSSTAGTSTASGSTSTTSGAAGASTVGSTSATGDGSSGSGASGSSTSTGDGSSQTAGGDGSAGSGTTQAQASSGASGSTSPGSAGSSSGTSAGAGGSTSAGQ